MLFAQTLDILTGFKRCGNVRVKRNLVRLETSRKPFCRFFSARSSILSVAQSLEGLLLGALQEPETQTSGGATSHDPD